jgi:hypothetical protein
MAYRKVSGALSLRFDCAIIVLGWLDVWPGGDAMADDVLVSTSVEGDTGRPLAKPVKLRKVAAFVRKQKGDPVREAYLREIAAVLARPHLGLPDGVAADDVRQAGWGVVTLPDEDPEVIRQIDRLLQHRLDQIGDPRKVKKLVYDGGRTWDRWLAFHNVSPGNVLPTAVPF